MPRFADSLTPRRLSLGDALTAARHAVRDSLTPRRLVIADATAFTVSATGRVFNSRFSDRFKKS